MRVRYRAAAGEPGAGAPPNIHLTRTLLVEKEFVRIPSLRRFDISREQDGEVRGFIPVYVNRFVEHIRTAISKA
jgi:hypothetical protein